MKPFRDNVFARPRPDLAETDGLLHDEAVSGYELTGRLGVPAYVEILRVGPGGFVAPGKDMPNVKTGDICLVDLGSVSKELIDNGKKIYVIHGPDLIAQVPTHWVERKDPETGGIITVQQIDRSKLPRPLMNRVLTERAPDVFLRSMYPDVMDRFEDFELPESVLRDGMPTDDMKINALRYCVERVIDHGPGRVVPIGKGKHVKVYYSPVPEGIKGTAVLFSTTRSTHYRVGDKHFKLTPFQDLDGEIEEAA